MSLTGWLTGSSPRTVIARTMVPTLGALSLIAFLLVTARGQLINRANTTVGQHAKVMASHTQQSFNAVQVLLEVLATDLRGQNLHAIPEDTGRAILRARMSGALAEVRNMSIMDADGVQLFLSTEAIIGPVNVADRDYFRRLKAGAKTSASGPYIGRNTNLPTYALAQRIDNPQGEMTGLAHAAIQPEFFEQFCNAVRPSLRLHTALVAQTGLVVATCDAGNLYVARNIKDLPQFQPAAFGLSLVPPVRTELPVKSYPLRVVVALSGHDIAHMWRWELLSAGLSAVLILAISAMIVVTALRHNRRTASRTAHELNLLEQRVVERTTELQRATLEAERANLSKSKFLAAASHDLRQPFQAMMLYKDILSAQLTKPANQKVLAALATAMDSGQDLLNALLHISTLEAGVIEPTISQTNLGDILGALAEEFAEQAQKRGLQLRFVSSSAMVATDPVLFRRMIRNLLVNALKYTTQGRVLLGVRRLSQNAIRVEVWDTGPGIPQDKQTEIWEEFIQLHNPERNRANGMGLGLAIVARTGLLLHHPVSLRSWPGRGSVFRVEIQSP